jgi:signal transduction histidine kinase
VAPAASGVSVEVHDTGRGMTPDQLAHAFDRFYKSADSRGSGLGLTIARHLVEAHGGRMRIDSIPGEGTSVAFTI